MVTIQKEYLDVLVFETNIQSKDDLSRISTAMQSETRIKKWNVDQDDVSNVLRIETKELHPTDIINLIKKAGYYCQELPD